MTKNPLVIFIAAAVLCAVALVFATQYGKQEQPVPEQAANETSGQSTTAQESTDQSSGQAAGSGQTVEQAPASKAPEPEKQAAAEPAKDTSGQQSASPAEPKQPAAGQADAPQAPTFDIVRIEEDGNAVIAGKAEPGSEVTLLSNGTAIGTATANERGDWFLTPGNALPAGNHEFTLRSVAGSKTPVASTQSVVLAVPKSGDDQPLIVLSEPDSATKVLQKPPTDETISASKTEGETATAAKTEPKQAKSPVEPVEPAAKAAEPVETAKVEPKQQPAASATPNSQASGVAQPPAGSRVPLVLETVDYNDKGDILFSGRAQAGRAVRLYVDNKHVGDAVAGENNRWVFAGRQNISPGVHELRIDQIQSSGQVEQRIVQPFKRADPQRVAALLKSRKEEAESAKTAKAPDSQPSTTAPSQAAQTAQPPATAKSAEPGEQPASTEPAQQQTAAKAPEPQQPPQPAQLPATGTAPGQATSKTPEPAQTQTASGSQQPVNSAAATTTRQRGGITAAQPAPATSQQTGQVTPAPAPAKSAAAQPDTGGSAGTVTSQSQTQTQTAAATPAQTEPFDPAAGAKSGQIVIQPGNNLWNISRVIYGRGMRYTVIYQANRDQIRNPHRIYVGQIFTTPDVVPPREINPSRRTPLSKQELESSGSSQ